MLTKNRLPLLIAAVLVTEVSIYLWARWTSVMNKDSFFAIEPEFIFDKSARNSGRVSAALNLGILIMTGFYGLSAIFRDARRRDAFRVLLTLFCVNHLAHFFFVYQNFSHHAMELSIAKNAHGFVTFLGVITVPVLLWSTNRMNKALYWLVVIHLLNVSYFIMETFYNKITPEKPAYHNQFGIYITTAACLYLLYRVVRERRTAQGPEVNTALPE